MTTFTCNSSTKTGLTRTIVTDQGNMKLHCLFSFCLIAGITEALTVWADPLPDILPDKVHQVYSYDRTHDRVVFGGVAYTLFEKGGSPNDPDHGTLYERDLNTAATRQITTFPGRLIGAYSASPNGQHIAARTTIDDGPDTMALHIVDRTGREIVNIPHVWDMAWSPDGNQLAYVTGQRAMGYEDIRPSGIWIYDFRLRTSKKVHDVGRYVAWAEFDRALYILEYQHLTQRAWRIDPVTQKPMLTRMSSIYLSPAGMYYYHPGTTIANQGLFEVYDVQTNSPQFAPSLLTTRFPAGTEPIGWVDSEGNQLLFITWSNPVTGKLDARPHTMLFDLDRGVIVEIDTEGVIGTKSGMYITYREKKFHRERPGEVRHSAPPAR